MNHFIIAVGGTGQAVVHYYNQLYLLGVVEEPYRAIVIDTDELNKGLKIAKEFFSGLRVGTEPWDAAGGISVPTIDYIRVQEQETDQVSQRLTALRADELDQDHPNHPVRAFFSKDALSQSVGQGLYARPALTAVIGRDWVHREELTPTQNSHVVVVGSLIGGTGGGLLAPLLASLGDRRRDIQDVKIRAVFFGEFFDPEPGTIDKSRLSSNQTLGFRSIAEVQEAIDHFGIVGIIPEERMGVRQQQSEQSGLHLPWPQSEDHPYWRGVEMVHDFLVDTLRPIHPKFSDREVGTDQVPESRTLKLAVARNELRRGLGLAGALVEQGVVGRLKEDPFAKWVWGGRLVETIADFWRLTAPVERPLQIDRGFCAQLQRRLEEWWEKKDFNLPGIFPAEPTQKPNVWSIKRINWPRLVATAVVRPFFGGLAEAAGRAAVTLLFWGLRG